MIFNLRENNTTILNELRAAFVTFITMSYILSLNPQVLSRAKYDIEQSFNGTIISMLYTPFLYITIIIDLQEHQEQTPNIFFIVL